MGAYWEPQGSSRSLLLVDDEENIRQALKRALRQEGYEIYTAASAQEGLAILARTQVAVVVVDQRMPAMSGTEFLGKVRTIYPDTIRIVLSGYTDLATVSAAVNEGSIFKFLTKPWDEAQLKEGIRLGFREFDRQRAERTRSAAA
ncbi:response regulator [Tahibacter amnicola]|uniref:Response regulator n=1 Tax=Tahibacter amnicola TaxID=2976241 RepID=A0ABY6BKW8_9GAMM|nr:response regulator [Tahibacter amnicola]UXI70668.1 response regulator [Tahibacter amnicola]